MPASKRQKSMLLLSVALAVGAAVAWWIAQPDSKRTVVATARDNPQQRKISAPADVPVIIYLVDTLRADRLGLYGYD
jgi:hypothetical protein